MIADAGPSLLPIPSHSPCLQLGFIFDCMATYEVLLFATLMARRLGASHFAVRALLAAGIFIYAGEGRLHTGAPHLAACVDCCLFLPACDTLLQRFAAGDNCPAFLL